MQNSLRVALKNDREQRLARRARRIIGFLVTCIHAACMFVNRTVSNDTLCNLDNLQGIWSSGREKQTGEAERNPKREQSGLVGFGDTHTLQGTQKDRAPGLQDRFPHNETALCGPPARSRSRRDRAEAKSPALASGAFAASEVLLTPGFARQGGRGRPPLHVLSTCRPCRRRRGRRGLELPSFRESRLPGLRWSASGWRSIRRSAGRCGRLSSDPERLL